MSQVEVVRGKVIDIVNRDGVVLFLLGFILGMIIVVKLDD